MERGFKVSETIARPVDEVWHALTDFKGGDAWMGVTDVRTFGGKQPAKGSQIAFKARGQEMRSTITEWQPPARLTLRSVQQGITSDYTYSCKARGEATEVTLHGRCTAEGFPWRLLHPLIAYLMKRADRGQLRKLKAMIEAAPPAPPPRAPAKGTAGTRRAGKGASSGKKPAARGGKGAAGRKARRGRGA